MPEDLVAPFRDSVIMFPGVTSDGPQPQETFVRTTLQASRSTQTGPIAQMCPSHSILHLFIYFPY